MALCPFAVYRPVPNHGGPMAPLLGVVIHVTAGEGDPYNEFANPANQVSSHFGIGNGQGGMRDGLIEQYVDTSLTSWAEVAGNAQYISVETEGQPGDPLTDAQVQSFATLYQWLHAEHGLAYRLTDTPGTAGFITHGDGGIAWGGHIDCPGPLRTNQRQQILTLAQGSPPPTPTPTPTPGEADMVSEVFEWNGQQHVLQISSGTLYNKWEGPGGQWGSQTVASGLVDAEPKWSILGAGSPNEQLLVTAERAADTHVMYFAQSVNTGSWGEAELP